MASDLPDALEKLALKQEQSESEASQSSLSKYFGQVDNGDDIFDTIAKPSRPDSLEPKVNFFKSPASTPVKEEASRTNSIGKATPSFAFKKCEDDEEPKVFSYFNQPEEAGKESEATEFFDQISELTSKTHKPLEISSHPVVEQQVNSEAPLRPAFESSLQVEIPSQQLPGKAPSPLPIFTPHVTSPPALASTMDLPFEIIWSKTQERASGWWIPKDKTRRWLQQSSGSTVIPSSELTSPSISNSAEFVSRAHLNVWSVSLLYVHSFSTLRLIQLNNYCVTMMAKLQLPVVKLLQPISLRKTTEELRISLRYTSYFYIDSFQVRCNYIYFSSSENSRKEAKLFIL